MKKTQLYLLAAVFAVLGLGAFLYKWQVLRFPVRPVAQTEVWELQARVEFSARRGPHTITLQLPDEPPGFVLLDETLVSRRYGENIERSRNGRAVQWTIRRGNGAEQALYYRATVYRDDHAAVPEPDARHGTQPATLYDEPFATARTTVVENAREVSADVASLAAAIVRAISADPPSPEIDLLLGHERSAEARALLAQSLLRDERVIARLVHGLELARARTDAELLPFVQVYETDAGEWRTIDPRSGHIGWPDDFFLWTRSDTVIDADGVGRPRLEFTAQRSLASSLDTARERLESKNKDLVAYSLLGLPLQAQGVYRILLMVPIGAFIMLLLRNFVGVKTFGTFMPVLVALAFRETTLLAGIVLFTLVVALGLLLRFYLEKLRLLLVPRLTAVLILVVLLMALVSVVSNKLGVEAGLSVALFPMIIMTMTIERMSVAWEERGGSAAIREGAGSLLVAAIAYLAMSWSRLEHLIFVFPELLLVLFAATLLIGRYSGYRLTELFRFRALAHDDPIAPRPHADSAVAPAATPPKPA